MPNDHGRQNRLRAPPRVVVKDGKDAQQGDQKAKIMRQQQRRLAEGIVIPWENQFWDMGSGAMNSALQMS